MLLGHCNGQPYVLRGFINNSAGLRGLNGFLGPCKTRVLWTQSHQPSRFSTPQHAASQLHRWAVVVSRKHQYLSGTMDPKSLAPALARTHSSHSHHSHHNHQDNVYLTSTNKNDAGVRITRIGLYVNLGMAVGKGIGGYVFHSQGAAGYPLTAIGIQKR